MPQHQPQQSRQRCNDQFTPATQPPGFSSDSCCKLPTTTPPADPVGCAHELPCYCPTPKIPKPSCLENLINEKTGVLSEAEKTKLFKTDLEGLLKKAKDASAEYTQEKYEKLLEHWKKQDEAICELLRKLTCSYPCWKKVVECYVCPHLYDILDAEKLLYGTEALPNNRDTLSDIQYWHMRDKEVKERRLNRIKGVLAAWEKPAQTIDKVLLDNCKLVGDCNKSLDFPKIIFDVFLRLIPMHLAIAPPASEKYTTGIDDKFTDICPHDKSEMDDCCGTNAGLHKWSIRQRWLGPQPYLIAPDKYVDLLCCLVKNRYAQAQEAYAKAEADLVKVSLRITQAKGLIDDGIKNFEKTVKAGIPPSLTCKCFTTPPDDHEQQESLETIL